jgi:Fe-S-cluster containining protein
MIALDTEQQHSLRDAVTIAAVRPEVIAGIDAVYREMARRVDERRPVCTASGRCCRFEEYGHRLFVTTAELAAFTAALRSVRRPDDNPPALPRRVSLALRSEPSFVSKGGACPFQMDGLCSVHHIRPFGCRVFYCDPTATDWQQEQYETLHADLRRLHERLGVPYFYVEWRQALTALRLPALP